MSRIAPLQPPYAAGNPGAIRRHHARRAAADAVSRHRRPCPGLGEIPRRQPAGPGPLSLREREIVIDRTCALTGCEYEWGVHVAIFAGAAELTEEQIRATVAGWRRRAVLVRSRTGADRGGRCAASPRHPRATPEFDALAAHYDDARSSRSSCCAASIAPCRISRTGWLCRWRERRRGFRLRHAGPSQGARRDSALTRTSPTTIPVASRIRRRPRQIKRRPDPHATPARSRSCRCTMPTGFLPSVTISAAIFDELSISSASLASSSARWSSDSWS